VSGLTQAWSPRSGERSALAQVAGSRLGEITNWGPKWDGFSLKTQFFLAWVSIRAKTPRQAFATLA